MGINLDTDTDTDKDMNNNMNVNGDNKISILSHMIKKLYPFNGSTLRNISVQTNPEDIGYTLQQRLALIDQEYRINMNANMNTNMNTNKD